MEERKLKIILAIITLFTAIVMHTDLKIPTNWMDFPINTIIQFIPLLMLFTITFLLIKSKNTKYPKLLLLILFIWSIASIIMTIIAQGLQMFLEYPSQITLFSLLTITLYLFIDNLN
jgi:cytochrome bd-type quinol oxidase subunit 2